MTSLIVIGIFIVCITLSVPIAFSLVIASILPGMFDPSFTASGEYVVRSMLSGIDSFPLIAVPLFVLSGIIMAKGGISQKIFEVFSFLFGKFTGGIPCSVIATCLFFGAISGSGPATVAAVGTMTIPILVSLGYDKVFSTALVAISGGIGVIIPPSIPFIMYAMASGQSVGDLFMAGIVPGLLISFILMIYCVFYCKKHGENRNLIDNEVMRLQKIGIWGVFKNSFFALMAPVMILGFIYFGITSPTEAAVISVFYSTFVSIFIYKSIQFSDLKDILLDGIKTVAPILFILCASMAFSRVLTLMQVPQMLSTFILESFESKFAILLVINIFLLLVGMVMDTTPAILILTPILLPIAEGVGVNPVHFGIIMVVNLSIGFVTPPIGVNLFVASSTFNLPVSDIVKKVTPMIICFLVALIIITVFPIFSLILIS